ncbi:MAG: PDZ domain-containing protein [Planctomycetes bacterium]|nr:PDZ domain-containing protein [Planctomycetota bacterium]MCB9887767.1 PDZ domain-containing protein [Planctomycetota bacterium]
MHPALAPFAAFFLLTAALADGWLGVYLDPSAAAAVVTGVVDGSPAQKAGLKQGDVIVAVGDVATPTRDALVAAVRGRKSGEKVRLKVMRGDKARFLVVTLGERPEENEAEENETEVHEAEVHEEEVMEETEVVEEAPARARDVRPQGLPGAAVPQAVPARPYLGLSVRETDRGVLIDKVVEGSPAAAAGVPSDVILRAVGDRKIAALSDLDKALASLRPQQRVALRVEGKDGVSSILVAPGFVGPREVVVRPRWQDVPSQGRPLVRPLAQPERAQVEAAERAHEQARHKELEAELQSLRAELRELRKQLEELAKRSGGGR